MIKKREKKKPKSEQSVKSYNSVRLDNIFFFTSQFDTYIYNIVFIMYTLPICFSSQVNIKDYLLTVVDE